MPKVLQKIQEDQAIKAGAQQIRYSRHVQQNKGLANIMERHLKEFHINQSGPLIL